MIGLGTIINSAAIVAGGVIGHFTGRLFRQEQQDALTMACGISVLFIAIAGAMQGMLHIDNGNLLSGKSMLVVLCLAFGTIIGEMIGIENGFERFGEWLKMKTGNSGDKQFVNAFVTASLTAVLMSASTSRVGSSCTAKALTATRAKPSFSGTPMNSSFMSLMICMCFFSLT